MIPSSSNSREKYCFVSICLVCTKTYNQLIRSKNPLLSISSTIGNFTIRPRLNNSLNMKIIYFVHCTAAHNSASVTDNAIIDIIFKQFVQHHPKIKVDHPLMLCQDSSLEYSLTLISLIANSNPFLPFSCRNIHNVLNESSQSFHMCSWLYYCFWWLWRVFIDTKFVLEFLNLYIKLC